MRVGKKKKAPPAEETHATKGSLQQDAGHGHLHTSFMWHKTISSSLRAAQANQKVGHAYSRASLLSLGQMVLTVELIVLNALHFFLPVKFVGKA